MMRLEIQNTFSRFLGEIPPTIDVLVQQVLTYRNDIDAERISLINRIKKAKERGDNKLRFGLLKQLRELEANEYVCWYREGAFPTGLLNLVIMCLDQSSISYELVDVRKKPDQSCILNWYNKPFDSRYYQEAAINAALVHGRGVIESAVGTGKTLMAAYIIKELSCKSLVVVPSLGLLEQIYDDFVLWFGPSKVRKLDTAKVRKGKDLGDIRIVTIQSLASLMETGEIQNVIEDIDAVFFDEIHHAASYSYLKLLPLLNSIYYRFGFTGTFMRNDNKVLDLWAVLSNRLYSYSAKQAILDGFLTPTEVRCIELQGKSSSKYQTEYDRNYCGNPLFMQTILEICEEHPDEQILILVQKKDKSGALLHQYLGAHGVTSAYVSGDDKKAVVKDVLEAFNDCKLRVLIGSSVLGEGIDIRSTDVLVQAQGGKSEIAIVQAMGRGVRLYEGKLKLVVYDFHFTRTNYLSKHWNMREDIYARNFGSTIYRR